MEQHQKNTGRLDSFALAFAIAVLVVLLIRTAWLSEDAFFTFRTIDNFLSGYGMRWNVAERVQAYTHPLWFLLLSPLVLLTGELPYTVMLFSIALTVITVLLISCKLAAHRASAMLVVVILTVSKSGMEYSTSGLENPLSHVLLVLFMLCFFQLLSSAPQQVSRSSVFGLSIIAALTMLVRLDISLLLIPAFVFLVWQLGEPRKYLPMFFLGMLPLLSWEVFSIIYYGFPFPNTAYAKLGAHVESSVLYRQGISYYLNSLSWDPTTLTVVFSVNFYNIASLRSRKPDAVISLGILFYLFYIVSIGGDYMTGRFFSVPLFCSLALLARVSLGRPAQLVPIYVFIAILACAAPKPIFLSGASYGLDHLKSDRFVDDERGFRHYHTGLIRANQEKFLHGEPWANIGREMREQAERTGAFVMAHANGGFLGYEAGPQVHIINPYAISDPLLARIPMLPRQAFPGHFWRDIPEGYRDSAIAKNVIPDRSLANFWEKLQLITRGPIWSKERFQVIWQMNTGKYAHLIDSYLLITVPANRVTRERQQGSRWNEVGHILLRNRGVLVNFGEKMHASGLHLSVDCNDVYELRFLLGKKRVGTKHLGPSQETTKGLAIYERQIPPRVQSSGFTHIQVVPLSGDGSYSLGHLKLISKPAT